MTEPKPEQTGPVGTRGGPKNMLAYSTRQIPTRASHAPLMTVSQFLLGVVLYAAPMLAMKALARRFDVELGGVCGFWIVVLVLACAASTTVTVVAGWQWVAVGTVIAILGSFFFANVIVG